MCAKQLYVKSNGTWVAAGGAGGTVDTAGLATEQFVTDAIGAGGFATITDLNDALANIPESAITLHAGAIPEPTIDTPQGLEDSFSVLDDGLHYFKDVGSIVAILRQEWQTTITITGQLSSFAKIVKSEAGLPTPQNPSMIVMQRAEGQWLKLTSDALDEPFGKPQQVDIFALAADIAALTLNQGQQPQTVDLDLINSQLQSLATVTQGVMDKVDTKADKTTVNTLSTTLMNSIMEVNGLVAGKADKTDLDQVAGVVQQGIAEIALKADKATIYTKQEVDDKLEADKDFSIANDNVLLASITSLQEIVSNLGTDIGTGQIDVLDAIRGVEIEPSMITLSGDTASPIAWKGGLSLVPVKEGDHWRLHWNDGKAIHTLFHSEDLTQAGIIAALASQDVSVANLITGGLELNELAMGHADGRIVTQAVGGPENTVAYLSDLSNLVEKPVVALIQSQMQILFDSVYTREESDGRYATKVDLTILKADLDATYLETDNNTQLACVKGIVSTAYAFGDDIGIANPGLVYADTNEGYGPRLILDTLKGLEYIPYQSDFEPIKARLTTLESKAAPVTDLSPYVTLVDADAKYAIKATTYTKTECDSKFLTLVDVNQYAYKADVYTQKQTDDRFMRIEQAFSKADFDNQMALMLYSRKQVDDKLAAISPLGSPSINDPALAAFKKSVLDAVSLMLAGGTKQPPADIGWTKCSPHPIAEIRMVSGVLEFRGVCSMSAASSFNGLFTYPSNFPFPENPCSYPVAARLVGSNVAAAYVTFNLNSRAVGISAASNINEYTLTGLRVKAAY
jgi:hypothetical protein